MRLYDVYLEKKQEFPLFLILIQSGNFYEVYGEDALIFNKIFGYKVKKVSNASRVGFPLIALFKVTTKLKQLKINYVIVEKNNLTKKKFNKNYYNIFVRNTSEDIYKNNIKESDVDNYNKQIIKDNFRIVINIKKYKLKLNHKTKIVNVSKEGLDFLGFRFYKNTKIYMKVRKETKKRFKRIIKNNDKYDKRNREIINSYKAHLKWGNCFWLFKNNLNNNILSITSKTN